MKRIACLNIVLSIAGTTAAAQDRLDRTVLPIAEPKSPTYSELDARNVKPPPRFEVKAPQGMLRRHRAHRRHWFRWSQHIRWPIRTPTFDALANRPALQQLPHYCVV